MGGLIPLVGFQNQPLWTLQADSAHEKAPSGHESECFGRQAGLREERNEPIGHRKERVGVRHEPIRDLYVPSGFH